MGVCHFSHFLPHRKATLTSRVLLSYIASDARDQYGDTIGGIGSSIAFDASSWKKKGASYTGTLYALPDRGW